MLDAYSVILRKKFFIFYNTLIYFLQKLPLFGKSIPNSLYRINKFEKIIGPLSFVYAILSSIIGKFAFFAFITFVISPQLSVFPQSPLPELRNVIILIALTMFGIIMHISKFFDNTVDTYTYIKLMGIRPRDFYLPKLLVDNILYVFMSSIVYYLFFNWNDLVLLKIFSFFMISAAVRLIFSSFPVFFYEKIKGIHKKLQLFIIIIISLASTGLILIAGGFGWHVNLNFLFNPILGLAAIFIYCLLFYFLLKVKNIDYISYSFLNLSELKSIVDTNLALQQVEMKDKDLDLNVSNKDYSKYEGIEYINKIFFDRTGRSFKKKIYKKLAITGVIYIGILIFFYIIRLVDMPSDIRVQNVMPVIGFFSGYLLYFGDNFIRYCFYNMDLKLMKYDFYRENKNLKASIKIRTKILVKYNLPQLISTVIFLSVIMYMLRMPYVNVLYTLFATVLGMLFFSLHYLFAYYLLQPFTENMNIKNPLYTLIPIFMYFFVGRILLALIEKGNGIVPVIGVLLFALIYVFLGLFLIDRFAHKTFKLR
ncbi:hypothetical protein ACQRBF_07760 [Peptoniphilaceae bacterium SGI.131]